MSAAPVLSGARACASATAASRCCSTCRIELHANEVLCVIGHNGAGKSTLMRTLFGLVKQQAGHVLVDGNVLPRHVPRALAAQRRRAWCPRGAASSPA